jgi:transcriptional regulator with XRE-family HTH domain
VSRTFAENVRELREARGISKTALMRAYGRPGDVSALKQIENGLRTNPSLYTICLIAEALGVPAAVLLLGVKHAAPKRERKR